MVKGEARGPSGTPPPPATCRSRASPVSFHVLQQLRMGLAELGKRAEDGVKVGQALGEQAGWQAQKASTQEADGKQEGAGHTQEEGAFLCFKVCLLL